MHVLGGGRQTVQWARPETENPARGRVVVDCVALGTWAQAMQVQAVKLSNVYTLCHRAPEVLT